MLIVSGMDPAILQTLTPLNLITITAKAFMLVLIRLWVTIRFMIQMSVIWICQSSASKKSTVPAETSLQEEPRLRSVRHLHGNHLLSKA